MCKTRELPPEAARGFELDTARGRVPVILLERDGEYHAYLNRCPHTGVNLDWTPGVFLDRSGEFLQCATHGALFRREDGYCVFGPCADRSLRRVELEVEDGRIACRLD